MPRDRARRVARDPRRSPRWYETEAQSRAQLDRAYALSQDGAVDVIISTGKYGPMMNVDPEEPEP
ncbi:MAG: hypothetical protein JW990_11930 [Thermoleophilia bacterium]|nr:hypothetical protein [Thermoleophilia bacterium]